MTREQLTRNAYYGSAKSKTFYKGDEFYEVMCWIMENVETDNVGKSGCKVARKYSLSVKVINENKIYKQKR